MKIDSKVFINFLNKVKMTEDCALFEWLLKFEDDGLKVRGMCASKSAMVDGILKKEAFTDYEAIGNVGMNDTANVIKILGRFKDDISLEKSGNLFKVFNNKKVEIELVDESFFSEFKEPELTYEENFDIHMKHLDDIFKDVKMNKDAVLTIETSEGSVKFSNDGKYKFETIRENECKGGVSVELGAPFINALVNLDGELNIQLKTDYPVLVTETTDVSDIKFIIAPRERGDK